MANIPVGFHPFWFWNDTLHADEVRHQIREMAAKGIRGFFIHPRQGLGQPYLSDAFFEMVRVAIEEAEEYGLVVHLYDEYPYPSGVAGGQVTLGQPRYHATKLVQQAFETEGGAVRKELAKGKLLSCRAYPVDGEQVDWKRGVDLRAHVGVCLTADSYNETGLTRYNRKRYFASDPTPVLEAKLPPSPHKIFVSVQQEVTHHKYWGHYADIMNPEAVRAFIEATHEQYRARFGDKFGSTIASIFVDETAPSWSEAIPARYCEAYGVDLESVLPSLQDGSHPLHVETSHNLARLHYEMFCESFEEQIAGWCSENGLAYSGEKPSYRLSQLKYMDIPGCDPGHTKAGVPMDLLRATPRSNARATASAAYFYEKEGALCECYHSMGWSATLQDAKLVGEGLLLLGIKYLVPHGLFYSTHALKKHDAPPSFSTQAPFWPLFGKLSERLERLATLFEGTHIDADLFVVDPNGKLPTKEDLQTYEEVLSSLMKTHLDFHVVDTDILESGRIEDGCVTVRDVRARAVIVPPMRVVEGPLADWLAKYEASGGKVVRCERGAEGPVLRERLGELSRPSLCIQTLADDGKAGEEAGTIQAVKRVADGRTCWLVLNVGAERIRVRFDAGCELREIPLDADLPTLLERDGSDYVRTIHPFESFVLEAASPSELLALLPRVQVSIGGHAKVEPRNANLLRMYDWEMSLLDESGNPMETATVPSMPIANQLEKGGFRFSPRIRMYFGHAPELHLPKLRMQYAFRFASQYDGPVEFVMEPGSIVGDWRVTVNEGREISATDLKPTTAHVKGSLGVDITSVLRAGENVIRVEVHTDRLDGGLLNPLYLAGDFGVELDPVRLEKKETNGAFEEYEANGLPYYAGVIEYTTTVDLKDVPRKGEVLAEMEYGRPFQEATEVSINGSAFRPLLWEPRMLRVPASQLKEGANEIRTRVYTTTIRSFEGQWFDHEAHAYREVGAK